MPNPDKDIKYVAVALNGPLYGTPTFDTYPCYYVLGEDATTYPNLKQLFNAISGPEEVRAVEEGDIRIFKLVEVKHRKLLARALEQHIEQERGF